LCFRESAGGAFAADIDTDHDQALLDGLFAAGVWLDLVNLFFAMRLLKPPANALPPINKVAAATLKPPVRTVAAKSQSAERRPHGAALGHCFYSTDAGGSGIWHRAKAFILKLGWTNHRKLVIGEASGK
jgi:hypothetical protein